MLPFLPILYVCEKLISNGLCVDFQALTLVLKVVLCLNIAIQINAFLESTKAGTDTLSKQALKGLND